MNDLYLDYYLNLIYYNNRDLIHFSFFIGIILLLISFIYNVIVRPLQDPYRLVYRKCFFCHKFCKIQKIYDNQWSCDHCTQYNGFNKDGDYNTVLPLMHKVMPSPLVSSCIKSPKQQQQQLPLSPSLQSSNHQQQQFNEQPIQPITLCSKCQYHLQLKLNKSIEFNPPQPKNYNLSNNKSFIANENKLFQGYTKKLEEEFKLCETCDRITKKEINRVDSYIISTYSNTPDFKKLPKIISQNIRKNRIQLIKNYFIQNSSIFSFISNILIYFLLSILLFNLIFKIGNNSNNKNQDDLFNYYNVKVLEFEIIFRYNQEIIAINSFFKIPKIHILTKESLFFITLVIFKIIMLKVPFIENSNHFSILINIWNQISNNSIFSSMFFVILIFVHRMDTFVKLPKSVFTSKLFVGSNDSFNQQQHQQQQQQQRSLNNNQRLEDLFSTTTTITKSPVSTPLKQRNPFNSSTLNSSDMFDINDLTNSFNGSLRKNNNNNNININNNHNMEGLISSLNIEDQDIYNNRNYICKTFEPRVSLVDDGNFNKLLISGRDIGSILIIHGFLIKLLQLKKTVKNQNK
ncbi:hypothetical protein DDB_G0292450 [Dictyostelium discoideum AX4]|uniref:Ima1 N-terminal domain-containing protein n=1 Tax=Dictyostelium discoideum TaxID=44689 RepID=Q54D69_DICDI|nr:hypothetical protein DDB_G0292450 [Dictyostelium discoideum AX4]EAL61204.1 hypothetical protein DDB_G0292450 [Dictyostelium discoideum AX4]|eukprot:XP_629627.1 hypothetical protein DDB_G0292450 [Dictyostelium discoideum AX4]